MRFLKSATEAWFNYAAAGMAAVEAWHSLIANNLISNTNSVKPETPQTPDPFAWWFGAFAPQAAQPTREQFRRADTSIAANPFMWWLNMLAPPENATPAAQADFGAPFFQFAPAVAAWTPASLVRQSAAANPAPWGANPWLAATAQWATNSWSTGWQDAMKACSWAWPHASFSTLEMPMTAWLMAAGFPYSVAAPAARANAASMDAAQAAREGFEKVIASFRNEGGHALAPIFTALPAILTMLVPFWLLPHAATPGIL